MRRALGLLFAGALLATACRGEAGEAGALRLDSKFGDGGRVVIALSKRNDLPHDAVLQPDGKLVVGGMVGEEFGVSRFDVRGSLDPTFGQAAGRGSWSAERRSLRTRSKRWRCSRTGRSSASEASSRSP
jgi:hypothetical protein